MNAAFLSFTYLIAVVIYCCLSNLNDSHCDFKHSVSVNWIISIWELKHVDPKLQEVTNEFLEPNPNNL